MWFSQTYWLNYKNLKPVRISWHKGLNVVVGPNASGKTNTLEALSLLCGWGQVQRGKLRDLVNWDSHDQARLYSQFDGEENISVVVSIQDKRTISVAGKQCSASTLRLHVPCLSFWSDDVRLIEGSPAIRRNFLNHLCATIVPLYARRLYDYRKLLRHKNYILRAGRYDDAVIKAMAPVAAWLWSYRRSIVDLLKVGLKEVSSHLVEFDFEVDIEEGNRSYYEDPLEAFYKSLAFFKKEEIARKVSLVGPHRDDLRITVEGRPAFQALSRGQRRKLAVAFMMASAKVVEYKLKRSPIILLDEVTAELDREGKEQMVKALVESNWQVITATADEQLSYIEDFPAKVWHICRGGLSA